MQHKMFDAFNALYEKHLSNVKSRADIFEDTSKEYEKQFGFRPYKDFQSFMSSRSNKKKRV
jgi:hypothetical protein